MSKKPGVMIIALVSLAFILGIYVSSAMRLDRAPQPAEEVVTTKGVVNN